MSSRIDQPSSPDERCGWAQSFGRTVIRSWLLKRKCEGRQVVNTPTRPTLGFTVRNVGSLMASSRRVPLTSTLNGNDKHGYQATPVPENKLGEPDHRIYW